MRESASKVIDSAKKILAGLDGDMTFEEAKVLANVIQDEAYKFVAKGNVDTRSDGAITTALVYGSLGNNFNTCKKGNVKVPVEKLTRDQLTSIITYFGKQLEALPAIKSSMPVEYKAETPKATISADPLA